MKVDESNAEHYRWGGDCDGWHLLKTDGLSVIKERVPPGRGEMRHYHRSARQFFYILAGEALLEVGESEHRLAAGQGIEVPPGIPHRFRNGSEIDVVFLVISSPKSHGDRVDAGLPAETIGTPGGGEAPTLEHAVAIRPLGEEAVPAVKALIADAVLEFYGDVESLPKDREGLLRHYGKTGYLNDLDGHASVYGPGDGVFLVLYEKDAEKDAEKDTVIGCGGLRRLGEKDAELVRLWLRRDRRGRGLGRMVFERLLREADALGYSRIFLDTSHRCADAVRLFRRNGFADCEPYKESIGEVFLCRSHGDGRGSVS
jgi:mannose-6-phosphate isomerase-like protein (cupin superfamily)/GNAT superfamily N-acetyltransferase